MIIILLEVKGGFLLEKKVEAEHPQTVAFVTIDHDIQEVEINRRYGDRIDDFIAERLEEIRVDFSKRGYAIK